MDLTKAMFVFQQVARVGVNNEMPKELYLARAANGADTWMVCGVFETDDDKYFDTIVHSGFGWKRNTSNVMSSSKNSRYATSRLMAPSRRHKERGGLCPSFFFRLKGKTGIYYQDECGQ